MRWASHLLFSKLWEKYGYIWTLNIWIVRQNLPQHTQKEEQIIIFVLRTHIFSQSIHRVIDRLKFLFQLYWLQMHMSYHKCHNLAESINGYLTAKIG